MANPITKNMHIGALGYALLVEAGALTKIKDCDVPAIQVSLRNWIVSTAHSLPRPANAGLAEYVMTSVDGVPFKVSLQRVIGSGGLLKYMRWAPRNGEAARADRIRRTLMEKTLQPTKVTINS